MDERSKKFIDAMVVELEKTSAATNLLNGKKIFVFLGMTGAGKSLTTLYLAGKKVTRMPNAADDAEDDAEDDVRLYCPECPNVVGHDQSCTKNAQAREMKGKGVLLDTPGFGEERGEEVSFANSVSIANALEMCESFVPVFLLTESQIHDTSRAYMKDLLTSFASFVQDIKPLLKSIALMVTKAPPTYRAKHVVRKLSLIRKVPGLKKRPRASAIMDSFIQYAKDNELVIMRPLKPELWEEYWGLLESIPEVKSSDVEVRLPTDERLRQTIIMACEHFTNQLQRKAVGLGQLSEPLRKLHVLARRLKFDELVRMEHQVIRSLRHRISAAATAVGEELKRWNNQFVLAQPNALKLAAGLQSLQSAKEKLPSLQCGHHYDDAKAKLGLLVRKLWIKPVAHSFLGEPLSRFARIRRDGTFEMQAVDSSTDEAGRRLLSLRTLCDKKDAGFFRHLTPGEARAFHESSEAVGSFLERIHKVSSDSFAIFSKGNPEQLRQEVGSEFAIALHFLRDSATQFEQALPDRHLKAEYDRVQDDLKDVLEAAKATCKMFLDQVSKAAASAARESPMLLGDIEAKNNAVEYASACRRLEIVSRTNLRDHQPEFANQFDKVTRTVDELVSSLDSKTLEHSEMYAEKKETIRFMLWIATATGGSVEGETRWKVSSRLREVVKTMASSFRHAVRSFKEGEYKMLEEIVRSLRSAQTLDFMLILEPPVSVSNRSLTKVSTSDKLILGQVPYQERVQKMLEHLEAKVREKYNHLVSSVVSKYSAVFEAITPDMKIEDFKSVSTLRQTQTCGRNMAQLDRLLPLALIFRLDKAWLKGVFQSLFNGIAKVYVAVKTAKLPRERISKEENAASGVPGERAPSSYGSIPAGYVSASQSEDLENPCSSLSEGAEEEKSKTREPVSTLRTLKTHFERVHSLHVVLKGLSNAKGLADFKTTKQFDTTGFIKAAEEKVAGLTDSITQQLKQTVLGLASSVKSEVKALGDGFSTLTSGDSELAGARTTSEAKRSDHSASLSLTKARVGTVATLLSQLEGLQARWKSTHFRGYTDPFQIASSSVSKVLDGEIAAIKSDLEAVFRTFEAAASEDSKRNKFGALQHKLAQLEQAIPLEKFIRLGLADTTVKLKSHMNIQIKHMPPKIKNDMQSHNFEEVATLLDSIKTEENYGECLPTVRQYVKQQHDTLRNISLSNEDKIRAGAEKQYDFRCLDIAATLLRADCLRDHVSEIVDANRETLASLIRDFDAMQGTFTRCVGSDADYVKAHEVWKVLCQFGSRLPVKFSKRVEQLNARVSRTPHVIEDEFRRALKISVEAIVEATKFDRDSKTQKQAIEAKTGRQQDAKSGAFAATRVSRHQTRNHGGGKPATKYRSRSEYRASEVIDGWEFRILDGDGEWSRMDKETGEIITEAYRKGIESTTFVIKPESSLAYFYPAIPPRNGDEEGARADPQEDGSPPSQGGKPTSPAAREKTHSVLDRDRFRNGVVLWNTPTREDLKEIKACLKKGEKVRASWTKFPAATSAEQAIKKKGFAYMYASTVKSWAKELRDIGIRNGFRVRRRNLFYRTGHLLLHSAPDETVARRDCKLLNEHSNGGPVVHVNLSKNKLFVATEASVWAGPFQIQKFNNTQSTSARGSSGSWMHMVSEKQSHNSFGRRSVKRSDSMHSLAESELMSESERRSLLDQLIYRPQELLELQARFVGQATKWHYVDMKTVQQIRKGVRDARDIRLQFSATTMSGEKPLVLFDAVSTCERIERVLGSWIDAWVSRLRILVERMDHKRAEEILGGIQTALTDCEESSAEHRDHKTFISRILTIQGSMKRQQVSRPILNPTPENTRALVKTWCLFVYRDPDSFTRNLEGAEALVEDWVRSFSASLMQDEGRISMEFYSSMQAYRDALQPPSAKSGFAIGDMVIGTEYDGYETRGTFIQEYQVKVKRGYFRYSIEHRYLLEPAEPSEADRYPQIKCIKIRADRWDGQAEAINIFSSGLSKCDTRLLAFFEEARKRKAEYKQLHKWPEYLSEVKCTEFWGRQSLENREARETINRAVSADQKFLSDAEAKQDAAIQYLKTVDLVEDPTAAKQMNRSLRALQHCQDSKTVFGEGLRDAEKAIFATQKKYRNILANARDFNSIKIALDNLRNIPLELPERLFEPVREAAEDVRTKLEKKFIPEYVEQQQNKIRDEMKRTRNDKQEFNRLLNRARLLEDTVGKDTVMENIVSETHRKVKDDIKEDVEKWKEAHPKPTVEKFGSKLLEMKKSWERVTDKVIRDFNDQQIGGLLKHFDEAEGKGADGNTGAGSGFINELGVYLQGQQLGQRLLDHYSLFKEIHEREFKQRTQNVTLDTAIKELKQFEHKMSICKKNDQKIDFVCLRAAYGVYCKKFHALLTGDHAIQSNPLKHVVGLLKKKAKEFLKKQQQSNESVAVLLAHLCAAWTIWHEQKPETTKKYPHVVQVLTIFLLLGVGYRGGLELRNHLVQVETGGGKSIILGLLTTFFVLIGGKVNCACFSAYLSQRDKKDFEDFWVLLGMNYGVGRECDITYSTLKNLVNIVLNEHGDLRDLAKRHLLSEKKISTRGPKKAFKFRILLIDEVDVFFTKDFYGSTYNPAMKFKGPDEYALVEYVWKNRETCDYKSVCASAPYAALERKFGPKNGWILSHAVWQMMLAVPQIEEHKAEFKMINVGRGGYKVAYREHGKLTTTKWKGYLTDFAYIQHVEDRQLTKRAALDIVGITLTCGMFSYAHIPACGFFTHVMGVTGTLSSLNDYEQQIVREEYKVTRLTPTPTIYASTSKEDVFARKAGIAVSFTKARHYQAIREKIYQYAMERKQPVLVFFDDNKTMHEFDDSNDGKTLRDTLTIKPSIMEETTYDKDKVIEASTLAGTVTYFNRVYGRGLDFRSRDRGVEERGGVVVLQTFFSWKLTEEIQIIGRTARQGKMGKYEMLLNADDLVNAFKLSLKQIRDARARDRVYERLDNARKAMAREEALIRTERLQKAAENHGVSMRIKQQLQGVVPSQNQSGIWWKKGRLAPSTGSLPPEEVGDQLKSLHAQKGKSFHFVLCLDCSGSMSSRPWNELTAAYRAFLNKIARTRRGDWLTVVIFSSETKTIIDGDIHDVLSKDMKGEWWAGTDFGPPLQRASDEIKDKSNKGLTPWLVFMSDGEGSNKEKTSLLTGIQDITAHMIFFGKADGADTLKEMAAAFGSNGYFHNNVNSVQLMKTFEKEIIPVEITSKVTEFGDDSFADSKQA